jgi:hypothetical protein
VLTPDETRIGFEFNCTSLNVEMERTNRLQLQRGQLRPHTEGQGISTRQVYLDPRLDLYVTNCALQSAFERPTATPCFGQSQDIAWITEVKRIELTPVEEGNVGPTLLPYPQQGVAGLIVTLPEWFENDVRGRTRLVGPLGKYEAILPFTSTRYYIKRENLFHPSDTTAHDDAIYLHEWSTG